MKNKKSKNIGCLILITIIIGLLFIGLCGLIKQGFRYEELKQQEKLKDYTLIWDSLVEQRQYKMVMFRELDAVAFCESGYNDNAQNPYSSALGRYQIIDGTIKLCEKHLGRKLDRTNRQDSQDCAEWLYQRYGLKHWLESNSCWNNLIK